jgi:hypothetical protein
VPRRPWRGATDKNTRQKHYEVNRSTQPSRNCTPHRPRQPAHAPYLCQQSYFISVPLEGVPSVLDRLVFHLRQWRPSYNVLTTGRVDSCNCIVSWYLKGCTCQVPTTWTFTLCAALRLRARQPIAQLPPAPTMSINTDLCSTRICRGGHRVRLRFPQHGT